MPQNYDDWVCGQFRDVEKEKREIEEGLYEPHVIHWDNIGITIGVSTHELCDVCKKDCKQHFIHYVIKCSRFECEKKYEDSLKYLVDRGRLRGDYDQ